MAENKMKDVAKLLGVELEEEFKVTYHGDDKYVFTKEGFYRVRDDGFYLITSLEIVLNLLMGRYEIIKIPKPVLTEKEKEYLSNVIKPFRDKVDSISKRSCDNGQYIAIEIDEPPHGSEIFFPYFEQGTMYQGMTVGKYYTLEELDL